MPMLRAPAVRFVLVLLAFAWAGSAAGAQEPPAQEIRIARAAGPIEIDGTLGDAGWSGASRIETFYETNPGDNVPPKVKTVGWLAYDDRFFYAAFEFSDPEPKSIRAPYEDRDVVPSYTDYGGVILDTRNDGKTAILFLVNPRNIQYDAITNDSSGEDNSADFYWDSATRIGPEGWTLEIRIPFSSLRYERADPQTWGILLYRNHPRDFRYQMFSSKLPRGSNCFICHEAKLVGLTGLPVADALRRARRSTRRSQRRLGRRSRRQVDSQRRYGDRRHDQSRFLADRVGRGADLGQRTLRPVLSREASVLPGGAGSVLDADPGGLHAHDHFAALGT